MLVQLRGVLHQRDRTKFTVPVLTSHGWRSNHRVVPLLVEVFRRLCHLDDDRLIDLFARLLQTLGLGVSRLDALLLHFNFPILHDLNIKFVALP